MPLGAYRINSLSKVLETIPEDNSRTAGFINILSKGDAQLTNAQYKFNTGTRGGSIRLDGSGDYLRLNTDTTSVDFSGDLTMEAWVRFDEVTTYNHKIFDLRGLQSAPALADTILIDFDAAGSGIRCFIDGSNRVSGGPSISANTWYHIALTRSGSTFNFWFNGTRYVNYTAAGVTDYTVDYSSVIGVDQYNQNPDTSTGYHAANNFEGYMDEIRWSDAARYSLGSSITVPTSAFTSDANTLLLLHGDGPVGTNGNFHIVDDIGALRPIDIHIQPNAQAGTAPSISTAQSKFGGSSFRSYDNDGHAEFASPEFGDAYTIEFWFRADNTSGDQYMAGVWGGSGHGGFTWTVYLNGSTVKTYVWGGSSYAVNNVTVGTASANTWHHFAISWDGTTYRTFLDGTMGATVTSSTAPNWEQWSTTWVGTVGGTTSNFSGYIDEYRQSDTARYTSSFTAPTTAFTNDSNTKVLLHFDGTNGSTTTTDDAS